MPRDDAYLLDMLLAARHDLGQASSAVEMLPTMAASLGQALSSASSRISGSTDPGLTNVCLC